VTDPLADLMLAEAEEVEAERETRRVMEERMHNVEVRLDKIIDLLKQVLSKPAHTDINGADLGACNIEVLERDGQDRIKVMRVR
jgi:hypothetical protein